MKLFTKIMTWISEKTMNQEDHDFWQKTGERCNRCNEEIYKHEDRFHASTKIKGYCDLCVIFNKDECKEKTRDKYDENGMFTTEELNNE